MTFYEAALRVLEGAGHPLHFLEITEKSVAQNLLSHVGKTPEQTMLSRLAAMARRNRDRRMIVTAKDTFALVEWGLPEDAAALAVTGIAEPNPEEDLPPLRPVERHPEPRTDYLRGSARTERRGREEDEDRRRRRRFPPVSEVAFEVLTESASPLAPAELLAKAKERSLCGEELDEKSLLTFLLEDNQRRMDAGRKPQFGWLSESRELTLERASAAGALSPVEIQSALSAVLGIPFENGRPVLRPAAAEMGEGAVEANALKQTLKDARRSMARTFRRRLADLDAYTFEKAAVRMLHGHGYRELKVAKRNNLGPLITGRKREGSVELRFAIRLVKGNGAIDRKQVQDLRRDMGNYGAQVGLLLSPGDPRGDARSEATHAGPLAMLWCGEALAEKFFDAKAGVTVQTVELFEVDERFFEEAKVEAEETARRREERQRNRPEKPPRTPRPERQAVPGASGDEGASAQSGGERAEAALPSAGALAASDDLQEGGEEEGPEGEEGEEGAAVEASAEGGAPAPGEGEHRRRRRRRRRGRRGRGGDRPAGAPGEGAAPAGEAPGAGEPHRAEAGGERPSAPVEAPPPRSEPAGE